MSNTSCTTEVNAPFSLSVMAPRVIDRVVAEQKARGLNDTETAAKLGVSKQVYTNWKARGLPPKELKRAAKFCRMSVDDLIGSAPDEPPPMKDQERVKMHGRQITAEEADMGIEWGKLDEPERSSMRLQLLLMVAEQVRRKRRPPKDPPEDRPKAR